MSTTKTKTYYYGVGRRKASTARAKIYPGNAFAITINGKPGNEYFADHYYKTVENMVNQIGYKEGSIDLYIRGGGTNGQCEAARLAIAKALVGMDEVYRPMLRSNGFLTTDIRKVLPKRPGLRKARKAEQWSKR